MASFLFVLCLAAAVLITALAVHIFILPLKISGRLRTESDFFLLGVRWGLIRVKVILSVSGTATLFLYSFRIKEFPLREEGTIEKSGEGEDKAEEGGIEISQIRFLIGEAAAVLNQVRFDYLKVRGKIGLGDAADTGILFGLASALDGLMAPTAKFSLNVIPVFETEALDLDLEAGIRFVNIYRIIPPAWRMIRKSRSRNEKSPEGAAAA